MMTFLKKISRYSEFSILVPASLKSQYGCEFGDFISFDICRRDNGYIALHRDVPIGALDEDTVVTFTIPDLDIRQNNGALNDYTVYDYKILIYGESAQEEINIITRYFQKMELVSQIVFGTGGEVRPKLVIYFNGGMLVTDEYPLGASELQFYYMDGEDFILPDFIMSPSNVVCEGFDPIIVEENGIEYIKYDDAQYSNGVWEIPWSVLQSKSTITMSRSSNWKYGLQFKYFVNDSENNSEMVYGQSMLGQSASFENSEYIHETQQYNNCTDYFEGITITGFSQQDVKTLGGILQLAHNGKCENPDFEFMSENYYEKAEISCFYVEDVLRGGTSIWGSRPEIGTSLVIDLDVGVADQISEINKNIPDGYEKIKSGDLIVLDTVLKAKSVKFQFAVNPPDNSRERSVRATFARELYDVLLTQYGKEAGFDFNTFEVYEYGMTVIGPICNFQRPAFISSEHKYPIGFTVNPEVASSEWTYDNLDEFVANTYQNFFNFTGDDDVTCSFLSNTQITLDKIDTSFITQDGRITLYPVFMSMSPFVMKIRALYGGITANGIATAPGALVFKKKISKYVVGTFGDQSMMYAEDGSKIPALSGTSLDDSSSKDMYYDSYVLSQSVVDYGNGYISQPNQYTSNGVEENLDQVGKYEESGEYTLMVTGGGAVGIGKFTELPIGISISSFESWGGYITDASNTFAYLGGRISFHPPAWADQITMASNAYNMTSVSGVVPGWNNVIDASGTYYGCRYMKGVIPEWGNVVYAKGTYYGCSGLDGIWNPGASFAEIMPDDMEHDEYTVGMAGAALRAYFGNGWGGTLATLDENGPCFVVRVPQNTVATLSISNASSIDWGDGNTSSQPDAQHSYNGGEHGAGFLVKTSLSCGDGSVIDAMSISVSNASIESIVSTPDTSICEQNISYDESAKQHAKRIVVTKGDVLANAYDGFTAIERVDSFNMSASHIGDYAFRGCSSLKTAMLEGCSGIGAGAFSGCYHLEYLKLGKIDHGVGIGENCLSGIGTALAEEVSRTRDASVTCVNEKYGIDTEYCITTIVEIDADEAELRSLFGQNPGFGAGSNVCFKCTDSNIVMKDGTWDCEFASLELIDNRDMENLKKYEIVKFSDEEQVFDKSGISINAHFICGGEDEFLDVTDSVEIEKISNETKAFDDGTGYYIDASITFGGVRKTVRIPVDVEFVDIGEVEHRRLWQNGGFECSLINDSFTAVEEVAEGDSTEHLYSIYVLNENVNATAKYDISHDGGETYKTIHVDLHSRYLVEGDSLEGPHYTISGATGGIKRIILANPSSQIDGAVKFDVTDKLFGYGFYEYTDPQDYSLTIKLDIPPKNEDISDSEEYFESLLSYIDYGYIVCDKEKNMELGGSVDHFYGRLDISRTGIIVVDFYDDGDENSSNWEVHSYDCGPITVWMPFTMRKLIVTPTTIHNYVNDKDVQVPTNYFCTCVAYGGNTGFSLTREYFPVMRNGAKDVREYCNSYFPDYDGDIPICYYGDTEHKRKTLRVYLEYSSESYAPDYEVEFSPLIGRDIWATYKYIADDGSLQNKILEIRTSKNIASSCFVVNANASVGGWTGKVPVLVRLNFQQTDVEGLNYECFDFRNWVFVNGVLDPYCTRDVQGEIEVVLPSLELELNEGDYSFEGESEVGDDWIVLKSFVVEGGSGENSSQLEFVEIVVKGISSSSTVYIEKDGYIYKKGETEIVGAVIGSSSSSSSYSEQEQDHNENECDSLASRLGYVQRQMYNSCLNSVFNSKCNCYEVAKSYIPELKNGNMRLPEDNMADADGTIFPTKMYVTKCRIVKTTIYEPIYEGTYDTAGGYIIFCVRGCVQGNSVKPAKFLWNVCNCWLPRKNVYEKQEEGRVGLAVWNKPIFRKSYPEKIIGYKKVEQQKQVCSNKTNYVPIYPA